MNENATANDSKCRSERTNCCRYRTGGSTASSPCSVRVVTCSSLPRRPARGPFVGPLWGGGQPRPPAGRGRLRLLRDPGPEQREAGGGQRREGSGVLR